MGKKTIAKIHTKFDLLEKWKSNYPHFLEDHEYEWKEILENVTKDEIDGALENLDEYQGVVVSVEITESRKGCWQMWGDILLDILFDPDKVEVIKNTIEIGYYKVKDIELQIKERFKKDLNEEVKTKDEFKSIQLPEEGIIEIQDFEINPANEDE
jgi:hypothetical protein